MNEKKQKKADKLAKQLHLGEVLEWRLHWLLCDLWQLKQHVRDAKYDSTLAELTTGRYAEHVQALQSVTGLYLRLRWETKTMLLQDYDQDVDPLFQSLPKHAEYLQEVELVRECLQQRAEHILAAEAERVQITLQRAAKG